MSTNPATPYQTTLAAAMDASQITVTTAASTGFAIGSYIVVGREAMLLTAVDTTNHVHSVKRGMRGTKAVKHASGAIVSLGTPAAFGPNTANGIEIAGYVGDFGTPTLPIGSLWTDPATGYQYRLCDSPSATLTVGDWVSISAAGAATALAVAAKGLVGIVVEAPGASDRLFWVGVAGSFTGQCLSGVTTALPLVTGVLAPDGYTTCSLGGFIIHGASIAAAPTTGVLTTGLYYATVFLNHPWIEAYKPSLTMVGGTS